MIAIAKRTRRRILFFIRDAKQGLIANSALGKRLHLKWKTNHDILDLITTSGCNSMCFDCSQMCRQAPARERITLDQVKKMITESIKAKRKWKKIVVSGGESTLEDNFFKILELLREYRQKHNKRVKLVLLTNGRGEKVKKILKSVPQDIRVLNSKKTGSYHPAFISINAAPIDHPLFQNANFKAGCRLTRQCGGALNWNGYYCCSTASAIDRIMGFGMGRKKLPPRSEQFLDQKDVLCRFCGNFLSCDYKKEKGYQSKS